MVVGSQLVRHLLKSLLVSCVVVFGLLTNAQVYAGDSRNFIVNYAWLDDSGGTLSYPEVSQRQFLPYDGFLSKGFGTSALWVRLTIDPNRLGRSSSQDDQELILRIRPLYIDEIELFDPLNSDGNRRVTGDRFSAADAEYQSLNFNFMIPRGDSPRDIYLKVRSTSSRLLQVEAYLSSDVLRADRIQQLFYGLYLSLVSLFLVWAAISWLTTRDPVISAFLVTQFFSVTLGLSLFGYVRDFFSSYVQTWMIDYATSISSVMIVVTAVFFYIRFWKEYESPKLLINLLWITFFIGLFNVGLLVSGHIKIALQVNMTLVLLIPIITMAMALTAKGWDVLRPNEAPLVPKWLILLYFATNLLILLAGALPGLGLVTGGVYSIYVGLMHGITNGAFAVGILQYRSYLLSKKRSTIALELAIVQQEITQERTFREDRERLLAMLAHELRTPLATVRMLIGKNHQLDPHVIEQIKRSVSEMNLVIQRSVQVNQLDESKLKPEISYVDVIEEIAEMARRMNLGSTDFELRAPASLRLKTDPQLFRMVISNLMDNAFKYREQGTMIEITVTAGPEKRFVEFEFANKPGAAGFPDSARVYDKYYRSPMAQRQTGSGLGMYLVKGILSALKGSIEYRPSEEKVRFVIWLPDSLS